MKYMMWYMIALILAGAAGTLAAAGYGAFKFNKKPLERIVRRALIFCALTSICYALAIAAKNESAAYFLFGLYNIFDDITIIAFFLFALRYMGHKSKFGWTFWGLVGCAAVDSVIMGINIKTHIAFSVERYKDTFFRIAGENIGYWIHDIFMMILAMMVVGMLTYHVITSPKSYIPRFATVLGSLSLIMVLNLLYFIFGFKYDYSNIFYPAVAFSMYYYSLMYVPKGLMERLLVLSFANMKDGIVCIDIDDKIVHSNAAADIYAAADPEIRTLDRQVRHWIKERLTSDHDSETWDTIRTVDKTEHYFHVEFQRIYDEENKYLGSFFFIHDKTEEYTKLFTERYRATHDQLTGLYNKERFYELCRERLGTDQDTTYYIIMTDIKNFKMVNDVFGMEAGDAMLCKVAEITKSFGNERCIYSRISNDRFAMLMPKELFDEAQLLERYSVVDSFLSNAAFKTHIHIGVYEIADRSVRISVMCDRANLAIKKIKDSYRTYISYYDDALRKSFISEHKVISEFDKALAEGQIRAYIQPQIAANGMITGGEALVRWIHPVDGMIPPYKFIGLFEQTGLIGRLDKYMWEIACEQLRQWTDSGLTDTYISVNISQKDFYLLDVYTVLTDLVTQYDISPKRLHLEITETALMNNPKEQMQIISKLRKYGFMVEIDDFGSGYSSLNMLKELDADVLKIDMGFLEKTEHTERSMTILKMIMNLAKKLEMEVITEGVETRDQVSFLAENGCDIFQGYYFAKPMPVENFEKEYLNTQVAI